VERREGGGKGRAGLGLRFFGPAYDDDDDDDDDDDESNEARRSRADGA
jgi:hypothetical protein